jgi:copper chaperone CopZ
LIPLDSDPNGAMVSILTITGMVAVHSKRAVYTALSGVPGVMSADVELGRAVVEHDASTTREALNEAVALVGCAVTAIRVERRLPLGESSSD